MNCVLWIPQYTTVIHRLFNFTASVAGTGAAGVCMDYSPHERNTLIFVSKCGMFVLVLRM